MSSFNDPVHQPVIHEGSAVQQRLAHLGIAQKRLDDALDAGDSAARQADRFSPVTAAGTYRWMSTVQLLRMGLASDGWNLNDDRNSPRIIRADGKVAVIAVRGTSGTGLRDGEPKTANPRGNATSRAVQINGQLEFAVTALLADMSAEKTSDTQTWFLLYFPGQDNELRAELSLPVMINDKGVVGAWTERILLPGRNYGADKVVPLDASGDDDVDFDIAAI
ncbi:hypothetical protein SAMN06309944_0712 [Micrococcales bacterium KH10]|nr:hypothetical protein SAMN06309944_0712 [Micrococcales bacterium KH10]